MAGPGEVDLLAIVAPRRRAADLVRDAWDAGDAVTVIDPAAPAATVARVLATVAPTHLVDLDGRHPLSDGLPAPAGTAAVVVTSGTTGTPKGVELTVEGAIAIGHGWAGTMGHRPTDHWLLTLPLHHVAGLAILARSRVTGADVTIVAVSSAPAQNDALEIAAKAGRVNFFAGLPKSNPIAPLDVNHVHYKELVISGSYSEKKSDFQAAFALLHSGRFPADKFITHTLPLERINEAFPLMESGAALKVCILPS